MCECDYGPGVDDPIDMSSKCVSGANRRRETLFLSITCARVRHRRCVEKLEVFFSSFFLLR